MNKIHFFKALTLAVFTTVLVHADDAGVLTKAMNDGPSGKVSESSVKKTSSRSPFQKASKQNNIELRVGPVVNALNDIQVISGRRGQPFDLEHLGIDDAISYGAKVDVDITFNQRTHFNTAITWVKVDETTTLQRGLTFGSGMKLNRGSRLKIDENVVILEPRVGFDVINDKKLRVMPYIGAIGMFSMAEVTTLSGSVRREQDRISEIDRPDVNKHTDMYGTYVVGVETQYRFTPSFYTGLDLGGYYLDFGKNIVTTKGLLGKAYIGYDITETWGVRAGVDTMYSEIEYRKVEADGYINNFYAQVGVKF